MLFIVILITGLLIRLIPAFIFYGTGDVDNARKQTQQLLRGENIYVTSTYNYYPPIMSFLYLNDFFEKQFRIPYHFVLKLPNIIADIGIMIFIYLFSYKLYNKRTAMIHMALFATNPVSILISGFHGQYDSLVILCILVNIYFFTFHTWKASSIRVILLSAFGVAIKPWAAILIPIITVRLKTLKEKLWYIGTVFMLLLIATLIGLYFYTPAFLTRIIFYSSAPDYGLGALFEHFPSWFQATPLSLVKTFFLSYNSISAKLLFLFLMGYIIIKTRRKNLFKALTLQFVVLYVSAIGLGSQYFTWIIPFALIARDKLVILYSLVATITISSFYLDRYKSAFTATVLQDAFTIGSLSISYGKMLIVFWLFTLFWMIRRIK